MLHVGHLSLRKVIGRLEDNNNKELVKEFDFIKTGFVVSVACQPGVFIAQYEKQINIFIASSENAS